VPAVLAAAISLAFLALLAAPPASARATRTLDPDELVLLLGGEDARMIRPYGPPARTILPGTWSVERARLLPDGRLALVVSVQASVPLLPVRAGPAVLFGTVALRADDSAAKAAVPDVVHAVARPCSAQQPSCLRARIVMPTNRIREATAAVPEVTSWWGAVASLVLVRTFAQGSWLQILPLDGSLARWPAPPAAAAGTLAQPATFTSPLRSFGLFTSGQGRRWARAARLAGAGEAAPMLEVVERVRSNGAGDPTEAPLTYRVHLDADPGDCEGWTVVSPAGDIAWDEGGSPGRLSRSVHVPYETAWYLRSPSITDASTTGSDIVHTFGPFTSRSSVLLLSGAWTCGARAGNARLEVREAGRRLTEPLSDCGRRLKVPVDLCGR
jgi:hypothetical protein